MLLVDFFNLLFSTLRKTAVPYLQLLPVKFGNICIGYQEKPLIAVNMVGIINARCHFTEASQQKVEAAALMGGCGKFKSAGECRGGTKLLPPFPCQIAWLFIPASLALPRVQPEPLWFHCSFPWSHGFQGSSAQR